MSEVTNNYENFLPAHDLCTKKWSPVPEAVLREVVARKELTVLASLLEFNYFRAPRIKIV